MVIYEKENILTTHVHDEYRKSITLGLQNRILNLSPDDDQCFFHSFTRAPNNCRVISLSL